MRLLKYLLIPLLLLSSIAGALAFETKEASLNITVPDSVTAGQSFTATMNIRYSGVKNWRDSCWPFPISCPIGLFLKIKWNNVEYRVADKVTTQTSENIYWSYPFDGSIFTKTVSVSLRAPETPGKYPLYAQLIVDEAGGADDAVASSVAYVNVNPKPEEKVVTYERQEETITPSPTPAPAECNVSITQVRIIPSKPVAGEPVDIAFKISINCPGGEAYGPFVKVYIKDASGVTLYCYRLGDQGYTECRSINEPNYYFKPSVYTREITIPGLKFMDGLYKIYAEVKYSVAGKPDRVLVGQYLVTTFTVQKPEERTTQLIAPTPTATECSGRPILYIASWVDKNNVIKLSSTVNEKVYAFIYLKNPYSQCTYVGELKVEFRKHIPFAPDKSVEGTKRVVYVTIPPNSDKTIKLEFVPTEAGEYHYDVWWNDAKYSGSDVSRHYSSTVRGTSDVLMVKEIKTAKAEKPKEAGVKVLAAWFEKDGERVFQVPGGTPVRACVNITSAVSIDGTLTINVKALAGLPQLGLIGDVAPDPVKHTYSTPVILEGGKIVTVCTDTFVAKQSSALHNEQYYVEVLFNNEKLGIFPPSKDGLIVIPKTGKGNPFIKGQDELANLVVISHGWYTLDDTAVSGTVPPGQYKVKAIIQNTGTADFSGTLTIILKEDKDLAIDPTVNTCPINVYVKVNETKEVSCTFSLEDGKTYHYEILADGNKLVSRGPSLKVRSIWNVWAWVSDFYNGFMKQMVFNPWTILGTIVIIAIIVGAVLTAPYWVPGVLSLVRLFREWRK